MAPSTCEMNCTVRARGVPPYTSYTARIAVIWRCTQHGITTDGREQAWRFDTRSPVSTP